MSEVFRNFPLTNGLLADLVDDPFPSRLSSWKDGRLEMADQATHFGFVVMGQATLSARDMSYVLGPGMYFSLPGRGAIEGAAGVVASRCGYRGLFQLGGPIEQHGRLCYVDGCSDTLLISPIVRGDPCLNFLHIPARVRQTLHTHPTHRIGVVVRGAGWCDTADGSTVLRPGMAWVIRAGGLHSFHTQDSGLDIIAYHPDSDFGPSDSDHPMLNRTLVDGVSAATNRSVRRTTR